MDEQEMGKEESFGDSVAYGVADLATRLVKSANITQATLGKQIEELIAMEARVNVALQRFDGLFKGFEAERVKLEAERAKLEAERVKLKAIGPELEQSATWAMRETLREQGGQIKSEIKVVVQDALILPLQDIQVGARHVRDNIKEAKWLTIFCYLVLGAALGLVLGYVPVRSDLNALTEHVNNIDRYLAAQQTPPPAPSPSSAPAQDHKKKGK